MPKNPLPPVLSLAKGAPRWKPYPWSRYSADDMPRNAALPRCPSAKCRRAKACLDPHKGLFCQRTHFTRAEGQIRSPKTETEVYVENLKLPPINAPLNIHTEFVREATELRQMDDREKLKHWRVGAFGDSYGRYRAGGFMKSPPPRSYSEQ